MAEYIEREALKKKISELKVAGAFTESFKNVTMKIISEEPTADVKEIVRCKDCKKFCPYLSFCDDNCIGAFGNCQITHMNVSPDFYCGHGEKKDKH